MTVTLLEAICELHLALKQAEVPHAFGGALALAWCIGEPRATNDIDLNIFTAPDNAAAILNVLPKGITSDETNRSRLERNGQDRLWWGRIPVDLFLSNTPFHERVAQGVVHHPFNGYDMPFLSCQALATFKAFFNRDKDWLDLRSMVEHSSIDTQELIKDLSDLLGDDDPRVLKAEELLSSPPDHSAY